MKHVKSVTKSPTCADSLSEPVSVSTLMTFIIAVMTALSPVLAAKYPTTT